MHQHVHQPRDIPGKYKDSVSGSTYRLCIRVWRLFEQVYVPYGHDRHFHVDAFFNHMQLHSYDAWYSKEACNAQSVGDQRRIKRNFAEITVRL